nr:MAG TPA: hypothetical protein [Bacteriophage sp.]
MIMAQENKQRKEWQLWRGQIPSGRSNRITE